MNTFCGANTTVHWKKGWELKSGEIADLCFDCGSAYENLVYCDTFHSEETGWRECSLCNKRLHCGCSASVPFIEIQDFGGVWCISCARSAGCHSTRKDGISSEAQISRAYNNMGDALNTQLGNKLETDNIGNRNLLSLRNIVETNVPRFSSQSHSDLSNGSFGHIKPETKQTMGVGLGFPNLSQALNGPAVHAQPNDDKSKGAIKDMREPQVPSLSIGLCSPSETSSNFGLTFSTGVEEGEKCRSSLLQAGQRPRHILPKPPKSNIAKGTDANKNPFSSMRVARPPAEGRLRNQLLPRYWPRITDQELQKLSGDLNSTIVPLFEKILSASDASRIGRLVLPKACAEAYFPTINQSEGLPLKIQDVKGNEWTFQFRFWPNNNSRMYVLEGVTPCIQSMQLQAGDTVTFSRIDPGGKLVIGYRKASNAVEMQDPQTSSMNPNGAASGESFYSDTADGLSTANGPSVRVVKDNHVSALPEQLNLVGGNAVWNKNEKLKDKANEDLSQQPRPTLDKKRVRNISSKSKRLLMHSEDAMELRLTWEETQDLLRPPPHVEPNIIMVEDFEFEEYNEPPVFGKRTFFTTQLSGGEEQWVQCDTCSKWRKLPADILLPPQWTCSDNVWDSSRSSCLASEEISSKELENALRANKDMKKRKVTESPNLGQGSEPSGLDALATAATLGDQDEPSAGATTRHPRHRPGCTCIVCIQPPSGKGKHKPSCVCNVCLTVKRRFKTLMMRKKKRQCEREAEIAQQKSQNDPVNISQLVNNTSPNEVMLKNDHLESEVCLGKILAEGEASGKGHIDLNCHPIREDDATVDAQTSMGMMSVAQAASIPLDTYINVNGLPNFLREKQTGTDPFSLPQPSGHAVGCLPEECHASAIKEQANFKGDNEGFTEQT